MTIAILSLSLAALALVINGLTLDMVFGKGRMVSVALLAGCFAADLVCRPLSVVTVCRQYRQHAIELIAKHAAEDTAAQK